MEKKRSKGVTIFGILLILGSLIQLRVKYDDIIPLFQPLPEKIILIHYYVGKISLLSGVIAGIGILCLKNIFRKIALFLGYLTILTYLIFIPFFRNVLKYIEQQIVDLSPKVPMVPESTLYSIFWTMIIIGCIVDFGFAVSLIYFFTRPKVKEQFR